MQISKLIKYIFISALFIVPTVSQASTIYSQTDKSVSADTSASGLGFGQTIGQITATTTAYTFTSHFKSTKSGGELTEFVIERCQDSSCSFYDQAWYAMSDNTYSSIEYQTVSAEADYSWSLNYMKRLDSYSGTGATTTGMILQAGKYYQIFIGKTYPDNFTHYGSSASSSYPNGACIATSCGSIADEYFIIYDAYGGSPSPPSSGQTQFLSVTPSSGAVIATTSMQTGIGNPTNIQGSASTTISTNVYISPADFATGITLNEELIINAGVDASAGFTTNIMSFNFTATSSGYITFSTTTPLISEGASKVEFTLSVNNALWYCLWLCGGTTYSTSTVFTIGTSTQADINNATTLGDIAGIEQAINATSTLGACNPFSGFDIGNCLVNLIIPSNAQVQSSMQSFYNNFLTKAPWGYGTIVIADIMGYGNDATSSLSASNLTITLPNTGIFATATSTSGLKGKTITFIDWTKISSSTVQTYWAPATTPLNNFFTIVFGAGFSFWLYHFFKKMTP